MTKQKKILISLIAMVQLIAAVGFIALPKIMVNVPTRYQLVISDNVDSFAPIFDIIKTPLPESVPVPAGALANAEVTVPALDFAPTPTTTPTTPPSSPTIVVTEAALAIEIESTAELKIEPTATQMPAITSTPLATSTPRPESARLESIEITRQHFNNCGPANLSIVLNYWGDDTTQQQAASFLKPNPEDRNVSPWQLSDYVNDNTGLISTAYSGGDMEMIRKLVAAGIPVIIEKGSVPNKNEGWLGHYYTVFGYDDATQSLRSHDTYIGPFDGNGRVDSYQVINDWWRQFNYTFFVVYRADQTELVESIVGPQLVDPVQMWQNAAVIARSEIEADSEDAYAWFNLGTSLTRLAEITGDNLYYQDGAAAFDRAFVLGIPPRMVWYSFRPYVAYMKTARYQDMIDLADATLQTNGGRNVEETYLYKGHALAFLGDIAGAKAAYEKGLALNKNSYPIQWALESLQ